MAKMAASQKNNIVDTTIVAHVAGTDQIGGKTYTGRLS
jgi:hypothetical protein